MSVEEWGQMPSVLVRIDCQPLDDVRADYLKDVYGADVIVLERSMRYGGDPVMAVRCLLSEVASDTGCEICAFEAQANFNVLKELVERKRELGRPVSIIRAAFESDKDGSNTPKFSHYEELLRADFETRRLD